MSEISEKIILQIDGGGIRGITAAILLAEIEKECRAVKPDFKLHQKLSLCCGTSTGAIMAAMVCACIDANEIKNFYCKLGPELFRKSRRSVLDMKRWWMGDYDRQPFIEALQKIFQKYSTLNINTTLDKLKLTPSSPIFMATAFNLLSNRTHFIKSSDNKAGSVSIADAITWSALSAAKYFGAVKAPDYKWSYTDNNPHEFSQETAGGFQPTKTGAIFQDGGQGTQNCTLAYSLVEIFANGWDSDSDTKEIIIISLGTGNKTKHNEFKQIGKLKQILLYFGQARDESLPVQIQAAQYVAENPRNKIRLFRLDYEAEKKRQLDDIDEDSLTFYKRKAEDIINGPVFRKLVSLIK